MNDRQDTKVLAVAVLCLLTASSCAPTAARSPSPPPIRPKTDLLDRVVQKSTRETLLGGGIEPDALRCNTEVRWETKLDEYARQVAEGIAAHYGVRPDEAAMKKAQHHALGYLVRSFYEQTRLHNLGALRVKGRSYRDQSGKARPLLIFRSGLILGQQGASACFESLMRDGLVRHVLNLYTGTFPFRDLIAAEKQAAGRLGASYFDAAEVPDANWRQDVQEEEAYRRNLPKVSSQIATLIRSQVLQPGGRPPRGNVYFHCGGGMHRSGMIFAIVRRCINEDPMPLIEEEYRRHVGWRSPAQPGGFEALNLRLVRDFDCSLLTRP